MGQQTQNIYFWNGVTRDALEFFNTGSSTINTSIILGDTGAIGTPSTPGQFFTNAAYTAPYTSNIPWNISASIVYSSSLGSIAGPQTISGIVYHSGSSYDDPTGNLTDQSFILSSGVAVAAVPLFRPAPIQATGLGDIAFNGDGTDSFNPDLPGNSGSGLPITTFGGHPKIAAPGTASLDFFFPSLTLKGETPALNTVENLEQYLSGSNFPLADPSGDATTNFTANFPGSVGGEFGVGNIGFTPIFNEIDTFWTASIKGNGGILFNFDGIKEALEEGQTGTFEQLSVYSTGFDVTLLNIDGGGSSNFTASAYFTYFEDEEGQSPAFFDDPTVIELFELTSSGGIVDQDDIPDDNINLYSEIINGQPYDDVGEVNLNNLGIIYFTLKNNDYNDLDYTFKLKLGAQVGVWPTNDQAAANVFYVGGGDNYEDYYSAVEGSGGSDIFQQTTLSGSTDYYPQAVVDVFLKRTGSQGDRIITSSVYNSTTGLGGYSGSYIPGFKMVFPDEKILNISNNVPFEAFGVFATSSTQNQIGDMYYVEYSMSAFKPGVISGLPVTSVFSDFQTETGTDVTKILMDQEYVGGTPGFNATGSLRLTQGNTSNPETLGSAELGLSWNLDENADGTTRVELSGSFDRNFFHNDRFGFGIRNNKVGNGSQLFINEITASITPSQSIWSPIPPPSSYDNYRQAQNVDLIVSSYYPGTLPFNLALDCQPLLNNFVSQRTNPFLMDIDYNFQGNTIYFSSSLAPVNFRQILSGSAIRAAVPDSNYTSLRSINPRYNGSKSTSQQLNIWNIGDTGTFGKNPTVELRDAFFGYFNDLDDPYPNINGLTRVNLSYLVDEQGNALPPSIEPITIDTFNAVFPNTTLGKIAVRDISSKYQDLGSPSPISRTMEYVTPICYSQNSGNNYSNTIPLSGSGYISRYDNGDATSVPFAQFSAAGTASIDTSTPVMSVNYILDPSELISQPANTTTLPYSASAISPSINKGVSSYPAAVGTWPISGSDLNNQQIISMQTSVVTSYVSETRGGGEELQFKLVMNYGSIGSNLSSKSFNLEYIDCKVYTETGQVVLLKNVDKYGWFRYRTGYYDGEISGPRYTPNLDRWTTSRVEVPSDGLLFTIGWEMCTTLWGLGLMRQNAPRDGSGVVALEWIISANSGPQSIQSSGELQWRLQGAYKQAAGGFAQGFFFPPLYEGAYTSAKIQGAGVQDHLLTDANVAKAPFWYFPGSDYSIIEMSSSNFNEAYGTGFIQGDLPYEPGPSQYFPSGIEPKTTTFDPIVDALEFQEDDEIRFGNNENFTYRILEVFAPQENSGSVKLRLNKAVDTSINKDFFLVRRKVVNPNSLYLDTPFPYGTLSSGSISQAILSTGSQALSGSFTPGVDGEGFYTGSVSNLELATTPGILFPDFPTEYLIQSASSIINDLISKGIIDS